MMAWLRPVLPGGLAVLLLHLAACGPGEGVRIDGRFAEGAEDVADRVWVTGTPGSAAVEDGRFRIRAVPLGGGLDVRFERDGEQVGRLDLRGVDGARRLRLAGLWIHEESLRAFPVTVEGAPGLVVSNGWRTGEVWEEGDAVDVAGLVLGRRTRDNTLAVRPDDGDLPDLLAVVDDETRIETSGGTASPFSTWWSPTRCAWRGGGWTARSAPSASSGPGPPPSGTGGGAPCLPRLRRARLPLRLRRTGLQRPQDGGADRPRTPEAHGGGSGGGGRPGDALSGR
jgi:hypothetical protein